MLMLRNPSFLVLLFLFIAAYIGNFFNLSLFFGVDFLFGSIAVLLIISLFGFRWGLLAAFFSSSYTVILWKHPYAAIVLIGEAIFVGLLLQRKRNLVAIVMTYWIAIGMPLVWIFYSFLLKIDPSQTLMVTLKQGVNGIFNAVVTSLILSQLPLYRWFPNSRLVRKIPFQQTLLNLLFAFIFIPALLLMILQGHRIVNETENGIHEQLQFVSVDEIVNLKTWYSRRTRVLEEFAQTISRTGIDLSSPVSNSQAISDLQQDTELVQRLFQDFYNLYVINSSGDLVTSYPNVDEVGIKAVRSETVDNSALEQTQKNRVLRISRVSRDRNNIPRVGLSVPIFKENELQGIVYATLNLNEIGEQLNRYVNDRDFEITLLEDSGRILASTNPSLQAMQPLNLYKNGEIQRKENNFYQWLPTASGAPPMVRWKKSSYVLESSIAAQVPWTLVSELPANKAITDLQNIYIYNLTVMVVISVLAVGLATILSRRLVVPLVSLAHETTNLPNKLFEHSSIAWADSAIAEIDSLARNFQMMELALSQKFQEIQRVNETLEQTVEQRTIKLTSANKKLRNQILERKRAEKALRENEERLARILETVPSGITTLSPDGQIISANAAAEGILGLVRSNITERLYNDLAWSITTIDGQPFPDEELPFVQVLRTGKPVYGVEHAIIRPDGKRIILFINASPLFDSQGQLTSVITALSDVTAQKQAEEERAQLVQEQTARAAAENARQQSAFLAEVSAALASSLAYEQTLQSVADLAVPHFADGCCIDLLHEENCSIHRVAVAHVDPEAVKLIWEMAHCYPQHLEDDNSLGRVIQTGKIEITSEITDEYLETTILDNTYRNLARALELQSWIIVPLKARDRVLGALSLLSASDRRYSPTDLTFVEDLARRVAIAIENASLFREAQVAKLLAETAADRTARLQTVTVALSESLTPLQVADVIVEQGMAVLEADSALITLLTDDRTELEIIKAVGYHPDLVASWKRFPIDAPFPLAEAVRTGKPIWLETLEDRLSRYPHLTEVYQRYQFNAWMSLPLITEGKTVGGILLSFKEFKTLHQDDRDFILALTRQCAQAILRTQLYEAERNARAEAEQANQVKDEFLAVLSHELRSPLNPILGWSALLRTQKVAPHKIDHALETIERNAKLQAQLVEDLLDISRMLRGKLSLQVCPVNIATVIEAAIETVQLSAAAKSLQIHTILTPHQKMVLGDMNRLQQVVWNLLSNAVKFTPEGGRVEVRLDETKDEIGQENNSSLDSSFYIQITISDTGRGIHPSFLPHVFDYFRQADSSSTRHFGGLGLGLAIARQIVELHGGTIHADSPGEGLGAVFTVRLPMLSKTNETEQLDHQSSTSSSPSSQSQTLEGLQVLVIDDEADMRELAEFILVNHGAQVMTVGSAQEALDRLIHFIPDVLLCDVGMPEMNGYTFIRQVRGWLPENGGKTPAIALTAYAGEYDRQRALAVGFQLHLSKPIEPSELVKAIRQVVSEKNQ